MINGAHVLVINHNNILKMDISVINETADAVAEIADRHLWDFSEERRLSIAREFVETRYNYFHIKPDGSIKYPIAMLENWILEKMHPINIQR